MTIQICVGSSCHLKGSPEIVELIQSAVKDYGLEAEITLAGCFCMGECNREGETVHTGVTTDNFKEFFAEKVLNALHTERK